MKRCPECGRGYNDDSLSFCLDDGSELLFGPASDEPATAILHETAPPNEPSTRAQLFTTARTSVLSSREGGSAPSRGLDKRLLLIPLALVAVLLAGFVGYRYLLSPRSEQIKSIAVLPFQNRSGDADSEYLSDGLAESLIYRLSQIPEFKVSPRSSVFRYKGQDVDAEKVGTDLAVDAVMSGRLAQRGDNLTISVDLVDVRNKKTLWGEQFERKMSDLLATQRDIASAIVEKLQLKLAGGDGRSPTQQGTTSNEAYQLYLQGRYFWNKRSSENLKKATALFRAATQKDPNYALAYVGLADSYAVSYYYVGERPRDSVLQVKTYANKAIELDPTLAEPHTSLAFAYFLDWNLPAAEKEFLRAIELDPNYPTGHHWYSRYLRAVGRTDEAWREINKASELEPLSFIFLNNIAEMHLDRGELREAAALSQRIIDMEPSFWGGHQTMGITMIKQGRPADALIEAQKSVEASGRMNAPLALLGHVHGLLGHKTEAEAIIRELDERVAGKNADPRDLAIVYTGVKDYEKAFGSLERGFEEHSVFMPYLNLEPLFEPLHTDPRWAGLKRRIGISN